MPNFNVFAAWYKRDYNNKLSDKKKFKFMRCLQSEPLLDIFEGVNMSNFQLLKSRFDSFSYHLLFNFDKCLYKKNGVKTLKNGLKVQYYSCLSCHVNGKIVEGTHDFLYSSVNTCHTHEPPHSSNTKIS